MAGPVEQLEQAAAGLAASFVDGSFCDAGLGRDFTRAEALQGQPQDFLPAGRERGENLRDKVVQLGLARLLLGIVRQPLAGLDRLGEADVRACAVCRFHAFRTLLSMTVTKSGQKISSSVRSNSLGPTPMSTLRMADAATSEAPTRVCSREFILARMKSTIRPK